MLIDVLLVYTRRGVVGVVGVFVAKIVGHFGGWRGQRCQNPSGSPYMLQFTAKCDGCTVGAKSFSEKNVEILRYSAKHI